MSTDGRAVHVHNCDTPAREWLAAFPLGNGRMEAMLFGDPAHERVQLNDGTAWSGGTDSEERQQTIEADAAHHALAAARASLRAGRFDDATRWIQRLQSNYTQSYVPFGELLLDIAHSPTRLGGSSVGRCRR